MGKTMMILLTLAILPSLSLSFAQGKHSPYAGFEKREIKALSHKKVQGYLTGKGMGLALAAELNHYPGPKHVLELATEINVTEGQVAKALNLRYKMLEEAVPLGKDIVEKERILDKLFAEQKIDERKLRTLILEIAELKGKLRIVHLKTHLKMKQVLSEEQVDKYDELRGYKGGLGKEPYKSRKYDHGHHH